MPSPQVKARLRAVIYCRISKDSDGDELGVQRQEQDCQAVAAAKHYEVAGVFVDNDTSALDHRPQYQALLARVRQGDIDVVLTWNIDRLSRRLADMVGLMTALKDAPDSAGMIDVVSGTNLGVKEPMGELVLTMLTAIAAFELGNMRKRMTRRWQQDAEHGRVKGGPRLFGFRPIGGGALEQVPHEADVVAEMAERYAAGETLHALMRDLNARGIMTARSLVPDPETGEVPVGKPFEHPGQLRQILVNPAICGKRAYTPGRTIKDEVNGGKITMSKLERERAEQLFDSELIPPIISEELWRRCRLRAAESSRNLSRDRKAEYLLTGLLFDVHGRKLNGQRKHSSHTGEARGRYRVGRTIKAGLMGHSIDADTLDDIIVEAVCEAVATVDLAELLTAQSDDARLKRAGDALLAARERQHEVRQSFTRGVLSAAEYREDLDALAAEISRHQGAIEQMTGQHSADLAELVAQGAAHTVGSVLRDPGQPRHVRQAVLGAVLQRVVINMSGPRSRHEVAELGMAVIVDRRIEWDKTVWKVSGRPEPAVG